MTNTVVDNMLESQIESKNDELVTDQTNKNLGEKDLQDLNADKIFEDEELNKVLVHEGDEDDEDGVINAEDDIDSTNNSIEGSITQKIVKKIVNFWKADIFNKIIVIAVIIGSALTVVESLSSKKQPPHSPQMIVQPTKPATVVVNHSNIPSKEPIVSDPTQSVLSINPVNSIDKKIPIAKANKTDVIEREEQTLILNPNDAQTKKLGNGVVVTAIPSSQLSSMDTIPSGNPPPHSGYPSITSSNINIETDNKDLLLLQQQVALLQAENLNRVNFLSEQINDQHSSTENIEHQIAVQRQMIVDLANAINSITKKVMPQIDDINKQLKTLNAAKNNAPKPNPTVTKSFYSCKIPYRIMGAKKGVAWIQSNRTGKTVLVEEGDRLKGYGVVLSIASSGDIVAECGSVIRR